MSLSLQVARSMSSSTAQTRLKHFLHFDFSLLNIMDETVLHED